jgi:hypothetical protein
MRVGTLDTPSALAPDAHIYTRSKLPWVTLGATSAFQEYYDTAKLWPAESLARRRACSADSAAGCRCGGAARHGRCRRIVTARAAWAARIWWWRAPNPRCGFSRTTCATSWAREGGGARALAAAPLQPAKRRLTDPAPLGHEPWVELVLEIGKWAAVGIVAPVAKDLPSCLDQGTGEEARLAGRVEAG